MPYKEDKVSKWKLWRVLAVVDIGEGSSGWFSGLRRPLVAAVAVSVAVDGGLIHGRRVGAVLRLAGRRLHRLRRRWWLLLLTTHGLAGLHAAAGRKRSVVGRSRCRGVSTSGRCLRVASSSRRSVATTRWRLRVATRIATTSSRWLGVATARKWRRAVVALVLQCRVVVVAARRRHLHGGVQLHVPDAQCLSRCCHR